MPIDLSVSPVSETIKTQYPERLATKNVENRRLEKHDDAAVLKKTDVRKLERLQHSLAQENIALRFSSDAETKKLVVELVNAQTGEAILQLPSKVSLKLAAEFAKLQGVFINHQI